VLNDYVLIDKRAYKKPEKIYHRIAHNAIAEEK